MTVLLCFLLPPIFLMYTREKVLGDKITGGFHGDVRAFLREYLLSVCFLNFIVLSVTYKIFHHDGALDASLMEYTGFTFHYLLLSLTIAVIEPFIENLLRYHLKIEIHKMEIRIKWNLILYAYAFLLFLMNFIRIFDNAFWGDEGFTIRLAQMTVRDMIIATAADVHPPLYYLLAQFLYRIFGNNGMAYHLSALLPYAVIMIVGCTVVKKHFGVISSIIMLTMASLMKNAVTYNVEVRMYALAAMFVLIAYIAFYKIIKENQLINWVVFCISSLGAAYTHYYALISVAFLFVMIIPMAVFQSKYRRGLIISYLVAIGGYLPWFMILVKSFERTANDWWATSIHSIEQCYIFLLDYKWLTLCVCGCFLLFAAYQIHFLKIKISNGEKLKDRVDVGISIPQRLEVSGELYWIISGIISIAGTAVVGLALSYIIRPFFLLRYLFPVSAVLYLMVGVCVSKMKLRKLWSVILLIAILWNNVPAYVQRYREDNSLNKETTQFLDEVKPENNVELVTNNEHLGWTLLSYYYPENNSKYDENALKKLDTDYEDIWLIWEGELDETAENNIREQNYTFTKTYEGFFANEFYYYVYKLHRDR